MNRSGTDNLFRPDIAPSQSGGIVLYQNGRIITVADADVELFVAELQRIRRRQLVDDCRRIAGVAA